MQVNLQLASAKIIEFEAENSRLHLQGVIYNCQLRTRNNQSLRGESNQETKQEPGRASTTQWPRSQRQTDKWRILWVSRKTVVSAKNWVAFKFTRVLSSYSGVSIRRVIYNRVGSPVVRRLIFNLPVAFIHCQRSPPTNVRYKLCVELKVGRVPTTSLSVRWWCWLVDDHLEVVSSLRLTDWIVQTRRRRLGEERV